MRLGVVVPTFPFGVTSPEMWLAEGLARMGHEVTVYSSGRVGARDRELPGGPAPQAQLTEPFHRKVLRSIAFAYGDAAIPFDLSEIFTDGPDVCLIQEDYPPMSQLAARSSRHHGVPYVLTSERYKDLQTPVPRLLVRALERTILERSWLESTAMTFHTHASLRFLEALGAPREKLHYIPAPTNCDLFIPGEEGRNGNPGNVWPEGNERVRILCMARLVSTKGLDTLASALAVAQPRQPGLAVIVRGRGSGEREFREHVRVLDLSEVLRLETNTLPLADLPALYRSADVYVQPSRTEPFGMATLEAMACGLPVIASATGGLCDLVEHEDNGLLVPSEDPPRLAEAIVRLASDPDLRKAMGRRSRIRATQLFDMGVVARSFDDLVRATVDARRRG